MGKTWSGIFEFLKASSMSDADDAADPPATASSLELRISAALVIQ